MRRRDHDDVVREMKRMIADQRQQISDLVEHVQHLTGKPREGNDNGEFVEIDPALQLVEPGEEWDA